MRSDFVFACLVAASCLASPCLAADEETAPVRPTRVEPLTRSRAAEILADTDTIAEDLLKQMKNLRNPAEAALVDDLSAVLSHSSEWEWYSRDHGILLAIPVKERLGLLTSYDGEKVLADVVRRLINQKGGGNPPVQVVLIEPKLPTMTRGYVIEPSTFHPIGTFGGCNCQ
jgi:hypothetical protein